MLKTTLTWIRPELLADADTWSAYQTAMCILSDRGQTPTNDALRAECESARAWALSQPDHVCTRWAPAYARVISALA